ncbi:hypothetical protein DERF_011603, partial [Dermatophagoides farinae]
MKIIKKFISKSNSLSIFFHIFCANNDKRPESGAVSIINFCTSRNFGFDASDTNPLITDSDVVNQAPACFIRSNANILSTIERELHASTTTWTSYPACIASNAVPWTHTCVSIPQRMIFFTSGCCCLNLSITSLVSIENCVLAIVNPSSLTVAPNPFGYCSVAITGTSNKRAARKRRDDTCTTASKYCMLDRNFSCKSQMNNAL